MHVPSVENPGHGLRFCIPVRLDGKNTVARQHDIGPSKYCFDNLRIIFAGPGGGPIVCSVYQRSREPVHRPPDEDVTPPPRVAMMECEKPAARGVWVGTTPPGGDQADSPDSFLLREAWIAHRLRCP